MAGKIIADTIETGAGADISTSYVVEGVAKHWVRFIGSGTAAILDSLSASSLTDNGTGDYTIAITNSMNNVNYGLLIGESDWRCIGPSGSGALTTSDYDILSRYPSNATALDAEVTSTGIHGDLA
mgnify:CR=1 FL=1